MQRQLARLSRNFLVYGIGSLLSKLLSFLLLPLFTRLLTTQDYGVTGLIGTLTVALTGVFSLGTANSLGILFFGEPDEEKRPAIIWTCVIFLIINSTVIASLGWLLSGTISAWMFHTPKYASIVGMALTTTGLITSMDPFLAYLRMKEQARSAVVFTLIDTALTLGLSIYFVAILRWGVVGMFTSTLISKSIQFVLLTVFVGFRLPVQFNIKLVAPLVKTGFPSVFGLLAFLVLDYMSRVMLQNMAGIDAVGVYTIGSNFGMVMLLAVGAFGTAWSPFFMSFINKKEEAGILFGKALRFYLMIFGLAVVAFFTFARPVVSLMTAPAFHQAYQVVGWVAMGYMLKGCYLVLLPGFYYERKLILQSTVEWLAALANIGLNLILIPRYGIQGAALATVLAYLILPSGCYILGRGLLQVHYDWKRIGVICLTLVLSVIVIRLGDENLSLLMGGIGSLAVLLAFAGSMFAFGLSHEERLSVQKLMRKFVRKPSFGE